MSLRLKFCLHYCEKLMGNIGRRLPCGNELTYKNGEIWSLVNLLAMHLKRFENFFLREIIKFHVGYILALKLWTMFIL